MTWVGGNTTEATTTSTTAVDLLSVSGLSILAAIPFVIIGGGRKTTGGVGGRFDLGLKINTTVTAEAIVAEGLFFSTSTTNEAQNGLFFTVIGSRVTNYNQVGQGFYGNYTATTYVTNFQAPAFTAAIPIATVTSVVLRAISPDAAITVGADETNVYTLATS